MKSNFDHPEFPSGEWCGYYLQQKDRHRQTLRLLFREGLVRGSGTDDIGSFTICGEYDVKSKKVWWTKTYQDSKQVYYRGYREIKGIWGVWELVSSQRGGFHIWPKAEGEEIQEAAGAGANREEPVAAAQNAAPDSSPSAPCNPPKNAVQDSEADKRPRKRSSPRRNPS